ncbi:thiamine phosphate synthase [Kaarinaea lacus]
MEKTAKLRGLYVITPEFSGTSAQDSAHELALQVAQAIQGGARIVQYRSKSADQSLRLHQAQAIAKVCQGRAVFIVNDDVELASTVGADGVHLGMEDMHLQQARRILGPEVVIGVSCYNRLDLAQNAQAQGADYVAFGRFFPSQTKPQAVQADEQLLVEAKAVISVPIVAIGGITAQNGQRLVRAGADMLAVIDAVFGSDDICAAAERIAACFPT